MKIYVYSHYGKLYQNYLKCIVRTFDLVNTKVYHN
nr:MAG TPA: hypothetical protein [Caudoviricetes sp.]